LAFGLGAYGLWGVAPLFWRELGHVPAAEVLGHRIVWAFVFFALYAAATGTLGGVLAALRDARLRRRLGAAALCVGFNWFVFVYAVMTEQVLEVSLGYFINPLLSIALGRFVLGERLRPLQMGAIAFATVGVVIATAAAQSIPWIALAVATSFGLYGLLRKTTTVTPLVGSTFETLVLSIPALGGLLWLHSRGEGHMLVGEASTDMLLVAAGPVTAVPLLLFVHAARRLPLTTVGFLQYLAPSLQFVVAVVVFGEALDATTLLAFGFVWFGLAQFGISAIRSSDRPPERTHN